MADERGVNTGGGGYPTPKAAAVAFFLSWALFFWVGSAVQLYSFLPGLYVTEWLLILGPPLFLLKRRKADIKECLSLRRPTVKNVSLGLLCGLGVYIPMVITVIFAERILGPYPQAARELIEKAFPTTWLGFVPWILGMGFSAGFCEEILFRGFIQNGLHRRWGPVKAVTAATLLFTLFHLDPWRTPAIILLGFLAGYLLIRTRSLFPAMITHITANSLGQILAFTQTLPSHDVEWALATTLSLILVSVTIYLTEKTRTPYIPPPPPPPPDLLLAK